MIRLILCIFCLTPLLAFSQIERRVDDFTDETSINTVMRVGSRMMPAIMFKSISDTDTAYYLSLTAPGNTLNVGEQGAIVLFTDGSKWSNEAEIEVDSDTMHDGWDYSVFIQLTENDVELFSKKIINKFRLFIYDLSMRTDDAERFRQNVNILVESK